MKKPASPIHSQSRQKTEYVVSWKTQHTQPDLHGPPAARIDCYKLGSLDDRSVSSGRGRKSTIEVCAGPCSPQRLQERLSAASAQLWRLPLSSAGGLLPPVCDSTATQAPSLCLLSVCPKPPSARLSQGPSSLDLGSICILQDSPLISRSLPQSHKQRPCSGKGHVWTSLAA